MDAYTMTILAVSIILLIAFAIGVYIPGVKSSEKTYSIPGASEIVKATGGCLSDEDCVDGGICVNGECICYSEADCALVGLKCNLAIGRCEEW